MFNGTMFTDHVTIRMQLFAQKLSTYYCLASTRSRRYEFQPLNKLFQYYVLRASCKQWPTRRQSTRISSCHHTKSSFYTTSQPSNIHVHTHTRDTPVLTSLRLTRCLCVRAWSCWKLPALDPPCLADHSLPSCLQKPPANDTSSKCAAVSKVFKRSYTA